jgi:hypothetical protein
MFAFLLVTTGATLGYLCAAAGFLVIVASVMFVVKGKAVLGDSGAPNAVAWGKMKANLTSAVALFALGAAMIALPFWRFQQEEAQQLEDAARQPAKAQLTGKIKAGGRDVRLLLVVKPDYDQTYNGDISWQIPLVATKTSYSVFYVDGDTIVWQQPFSVADLAPGSPQQTIPLPDWELQATNSAAPAITPQLEVSNAEVQKSLNLR